MNVEEYCIENNKQELLQQFMSDIDFMLNMGGPETAMHTKYIISLNKEKLLNTLTIIQKLSDVMLKNSDNIERCAV